MTLGQITPILRMFDAGKAKEFYLDYLGFRLDWEHRFEDGMPLYMQVSRDSVVLHLSEHYGDCTPGSAIRIEAEGVRKLHEELRSKNYAYLRPGLEATPWGTFECCLLDPFGNKIIYYEATGSDPE